MDNGTSSEEIYRRLEKEIIELKIKPGEAVSEHALCERFGVSRTPVRSVLQRLEENGLVTIEPYKRTQVTLLDYDIINQIIYQRVAVECMVLRDFMSICTPMHIERIRFLISSSRKLISQAFESSDFYRLDSALHALWFSETKKPYLWACIQKSQCNYSRFRMLDIVEQHDYESIVSEHQVLLDILIRKDLPAIEPLMIKHLYGGITRLGERIYTDLKEYFIQKNPD